MSASFDSRPRTVVLLQHSGIGDLIWHIQYIKAIAEKSKGGQVTVVAQPSTLTRSIIGHEAWVEEVIDHDHRPRRTDRRKGAHAGIAGMLRMARVLKSGQFERIILFSGRPSRGLIAAMSGIPIRMGFGYNLLQRMFLNTSPYIKAYTGPSVRVFPEASAFAIAHGFCEGPITPRLDPRPDQIDVMTQRLASLPRPLVALAIGTSEPHKQWGIDRFAALATALIREGFGVVVLGGRAEAELAQRLENQVPPELRGSLVTITDATVPGSAAALQIANLCVGNDTGMVNVAAAVGRHSLVLTGPRPLLDHDPLIQNIQANKLSNITVEQVLTLVQNICSRPQSA